MKVIDNFFDEKTFTDIQSIIDSGSFKFGWKSNTSKPYDNGHFNMIISNQKEVFGRVDLARTDQLMHMQPFQTMW